MSAPLYEKLMAYSKDGVYPFHMPGHKRAVEMDPVFALDITEIDGFDNLHQPEGVIAQAQNLAAAAFGADHSFFLVNGASGGLQAAVLAHCRNKKVIVARNCHKSVYDGLILSGAEPVYIMPRVQPDFPVFGGIDPEELEQCCEENRDAAAVIIVSPTYEGIVSDIKAMGEIVHRYDMLLIVDEAHGAHFNFSSYFPESAVKLGADIVVQSAHKTLPAPTQTAFLHVAGERVDLELLKRCLSMTQTSSPSYLLMGMLDRCRNYMVQDGQTVMTAYTQELETLRKKLSQLQYFKLLSGEGGNTNFCFDYDRSKIVLACTCMNCVEIGHILRTEKKIELEMTLPTHFVAMTSLMDRAEGFRRLLDSLMELDSRFSIQFGEGQSRLYSGNGLPNSKEISYSEMELGERRTFRFTYPKPKVIKKPAESFGAQRKLIPLSKSIGCVSAEFIIPYPPGVPILVPGERITEEIVESVLYYKDCNINVIGIEKLNIEKISVLK